jgi:hypothetical protein
MRLFVLLRPLRLFRMGIMIMFRILLGYVFTITSLEL